MLNLKIDKIFKYLVQKIFFIYNCNILINSVIKFKNKDLVNKSPSKINDH